MFHFIRTDTVPLTRDLVEDFATMPHFVGDRNRETRAGQSRIDFLRAEYDAGRFYDPDWHTAALNGTVYRVNGGHSSMMLANLPPDKFPTNLSAKIGRWTCETASELADIFELFDRRESIRTLNDKIHAYAATSGVDSVNSNSIRKAVSGIACHFNHATENGRLSENDKSKFVSVYPEFIRWVGSYVSTARFGRAPFIGAIFALWLKNRQAVEDAANAWAQGMPTRLNYQEALPVPQPSAAWNAWRRQRCTEE